MVSINRDMAFKIIHLAYVVILPPPVNGESDGLGMEKFSGESVEAGPLEMLRHRTDDLAVLDPKQLANSVNTSVCAKDGQHLGNACEVVNVEAELTPRHRIL